MKLLRIFALLFFVLSGAAFYGSHYITNQVLEGQAQISSAEKKVKQADSLFSLTPQTKALGGAITNSAQDKINMGKEQVAYYANLADMIQKGAIGLLIAGGILLIISFFKKRSK